MTPPRTCPGQKQVSVVKSRNWMPDIIISLNLNIRNISSFSLSKIKVRVWLQHFQSRIIEAYSEQSYCQSVTPERFCCGKFLLVKCRIELSLANFSASYKVSEFCGHLQRFSHKMRDCVSFVLMMKMEWQSDKTRLPCSIKRKRCNNRKPTQLHICKIYISRIFSLLFVSIFMREEELCGGSVSKFLD